MIIDCHAHVFQNWHGACGHPSIDVHLKYIQKNVTRPAAETFRVRDGKRVKPGLLFRDGDNTWAGLDGCRLPRRPLWPARVHARGRGIRDPVHAGRHADDRVAARVHDRADAGCRRRPLHPAGGRRLRRDERLQRLRAEPSTRTSSPACCMSTRRRPIARRRWPRSTARMTLGLKGLYYAQDFSRHGYARNLDHDAISARSGTGSRRGGFPVFLELSATPNYDKASYIANLMALDRLMQRYPATALRARHGAAGRAFRAAAGNGISRRKCSRPTSATIC